ncbi:nickel ABC transporter ATP-binding protein NikE [Sphingorhabdus sp. Alg239-R122]|uniref:nickel ABC transporter ATP-binding protein NikE n=1 Tax=Sphingorhabdus sp. Alg239-R122 TaxID=2305989 RepID=UPI0013DD1E9D|nr:nickel ABC transporter ATP-binding protein NikE [Sphingorhabdus sp. Alg239-R122]
MSIYSVRELGSEIGKDTLSHGLDFTIAAGECVALVGESGSGKSVSCLAPFGLIAPHMTGSAILDGTELANCSESELRRLRAQKAGFIFQQPLTALTPHMRTEQHLRESAMQAGGEPPDHGRLAAMLKNVGLTDIEANLRKYPHELSGGERQRVMIACAIAHDPVLLVADEPTSALDAHLRGEIMELLGRLRRERGMALLLVSHDLPSVARHADHIVIMRRGKVIESGPSDKIIRHPKADYSRQLWDATPKLDDPAPQLPAIGTPLLEVRDVAVDYPRSGIFRAPFRAVEPANLTVHAGEAVALVGGSGSGKSSIGKAIAGIGPWSEGEILWQGGALPHKRNKAQKRAVQTVFQDPVASLDPRWRVEDIVAEPLTHLRGEMTKAERHASVAAALETVGLDAAFMQRRPTQISGGQAQRVAIARALVCKPEMLVLDEATSALDPVIGAEIVALLQQLQSGKSLTMLFITHDLALARKLCHRILVLHQGQVVEQGTADDIIAKPQSDITRRLVTASRDG